MKKISLQGLFIKSKMIYFRIGYLYGEKILKILEKDRQRKVDSLNKENLDKQSLYWNKSNKNFLIGQL